MKHSIEQLNKKLNKFNITQLESSLSNLGFVINQLVEKYDNLILNPDRVSQKQYEINIQLKEKYSKLIEYLYELFNNTHFLPHEKMNQQLKAVGVDIQFEDSEIFSEDETMSLIVRVINCELQGINKNSLKHKLLLQLLNTLEPNYL